MIQNGEQGWFRLDQGVVKPPPRHLKEVAEGDVPGGQGATKGAGADAAAKKKEADAKVRWRTP